MPPPEPTHREVYEQLVAALRERGASHLADEIERTIARGVVMTGQATELYKVSTVYRPMEDAEALAVALEFFITALEVPLMLDATTRSLGAGHIDWKPERPGTEREHVVADAALQVDRAALRDLLDKVITIAEELGIVLPEIA
ncbi:MAG: hypothetical protein NUV77_23060 [Thermoguttaceae bacterium]|jgi:hypothetical protein|nr:hypothetical protein [Thermoguttaceae bacterium]